jgi:hypothetical protein
VCIGSIRRAVEGQAIVASTVEIEQKVDNDSEATLIAGTTVAIGQTLDQCSTVTITAQGDVVINETIDQHANVEIPSANGNIDIGQGLSGEAIAALIALKGDIHIGESVDAGSTLNWDARQLNCPRQDGTINHL